MPNKKFNTWDGLSDADWKLIAGKTRNVKPLSAINHEAREKLQSAAYFRAVDVAPNLFQLMGYRQGIAQSILSGMYDGESRENAVRIMKTVNNDIKKLLAL